VAEEAEQADDGVVHGGEVQGRVPLPDPRAVFTLGDVADVVDSVPDGPVAADPAGEQARVGLAMVQ